MLVSMPNVQCSNSSLYVEKGAKQNVVILTNISEIFVACRIYDGNWDKDLYTNHVSLFDKQFLEFLSLLEK